MREIKFRAWNKDNRAMVDLFKITPLALDDNMNTQLAMRGESGLFIPFCKDIELMQFTGLKDKNGKEIYEGDIIDQSKYPDEPCPFVVVFEDGSFRKKYNVWDESLSKPQINEISLSILDEVVIGNIYENPELLKD